MAVSISLLLNSDTDGYGFDQHTDEELRKIEGSSASSHRGVPFLWLNWWSWRPADNAKPVSTADVRRANPSEHADVRSLPYSGCKFTKSAVEPLSTLMDCSSISSG